MLACGFKPNQILGLEQALRNPKKPRRRRGTPILLAGGGISVAHESDASAVGGVLGRRLSCSEAIA
jgi:hypothetical protein